MFEIQGVQPGLVFDQFSVEFWRNSKINVILLLVWVQFICAMLIF